MKKLLIVLSILYIVSCDVQTWKFRGSQVFPLTGDYYKMINSMQNSWVSGENARFKGYKMEDIKRLLGAKKTPAHLKLPVKVQNDLILDAIPTEFDARTAWPNCQSIKEVRDQSACGSCWAFGAVEAFSDRICIASGQTLQTRISATDLLACCSSCGDGCDGGYPESAWQYFQDSGAVTGDLYGDNSWCKPYPFQPCEHHVSGSYPDFSTLSYSTPSCDTTCNPSYTKNTYDNDKFYVSSSYSVPSDVASIQQEILTNGPVEISITVYEDFLTYKSGVYYYTTGSELGGHAVKMLGWGTENGVDYWLVANSWNNSWGDNGFIKIRRGTDECGIESGVVAGTVKLPSKQN